MKEPVMWSSTSGRRTLTDLEAIMLIADFLGLDESPSASLPAAA
jgi:hypothetical protein